MRGKRRSAWEEYQDLAYTSEEQRKKQPAPEKKRKGKRFLGRARQYAQTGAVALSLGAAYFLGQHSAGGVGEEQAAPEALRQEHVLLERENDSLTARNAALERVIAASEDARLAARYDSAVQERRLAVNSYAQLLVEHEKLLAEQERWDEQRDALLRGNRYAPERPPEAIDTITIPDDKYFLVVDKEAQRLYVWRPANYVLVADAPVSTGLVRGEKERAGDNRTPSGFAMIEQRHVSDAWTYAGERAYGPLAFRLNFGSWSSSGEYDPEGHCSILLHGTNEPEHLGKRRSHGCPRLHNEFLLEAERQGYLRPGTYVYTIPEDEGALLLSAHGLGTERLRNISGNGVEVDKNKR
ncbi:L,D-transpeptidase [Candidatus Woesearchaeota archaeon]|nr:L,D-transpeptidase [Candidatus Woesearchaeota archaeon]